MSESNETSPTEKLLLRALIISLLLHLLLFSIWRVGKAEGWWRDLALPRWLQSLSKAMMPVKPKKPVVETPLETQLTFVDVDPTLATPEPPKKPMFQGAKNTVAANREIKELSVMPNIEGHQDKYLKTTESAKPVVQPQPQPSPPPTPPQPPPQPQPQNAPPQSAPKKSYTPGDLAMVRPSDKAQEGKTDAEAADPAKPQPQPQPQPKPAYERPRTIAEALAKSGSVGQQSRNNGGVSHISPNVALDVQGTPMGDYLARMVTAVQVCWDSILKDQSPDVTGRVVLHFRLLPDGSVKDVKMVRNEVTDVLELACERAITKPAPFEKWTHQMILDIPDDHYDITFTFYYEP